MEAKTENTVKILLTLAFYNLESYWSDPLVINMPKTKTKNMQLISQKLLQCFPIF
jgi:hypothetical protein